MGKKSNPPLLQQTWVEAGLSFDSEEQDRLNVLQINGILDCLEVSSLRQMSPTVGSGTDG